MQTLRRSHLTVVCALCVKAKMVVTRASPGHAKALLELLPHETQIWSK